MLNRTMQGEDWSLLVQALVELSNTPDKRHLLNPSIEPDFVAERSTERTQELTPTQTDEYDENLHSLCVADRAYRSILGMPS